MRITRPLETVDLIHVKFNLPGPDLIPQDLAAYIQIHSAPLSHNRSLEGELIAQDSHSGDLGQLPMNINALGYELAIARYHYNVAHFYFLNGQRCSQTVMTSEESALPLRALDNLLTVYLWQYRIYRNPFIWGRERRTDRHGVSMSVRCPQSRLTRMRRVDTTFGSISSSTVRLTKTQIVVYQALKEGCSRVGQV